VGQVLRQIEGNGGRDKSKEKGETKRGFGNGGREEERGFSERDTTEKKGDMESLSY
jgi:hypothetical protein